MVLGGCLGSGPSCTDEDSWRSFEQRLVVPSLSVAVWFVIHFDSHWQTIHEPWRVMGITPLDFYIFGASMRSRLPFLEESSNMPSIDT